MQAQLFLGIPYTSEIEKMIACLPPPVVSLWIQEDPSPYLQKVDREGASFLGKQLASPIRLSALEDSAAHILSLLRQLIPPKSLTFSLDALILLNLLPT